MDFSLRAIRFGLAAWLALFSDNAFAEQHHVEIRGLSGEALDNVKAYLQVNGDGLAPKLSAGEQAQWDARAETEAGKALSALGYYAPEITLTEQADGTRVLTITPGEPVRVRTLTVEVFGDGQHDKTYRKLLKNLPLKTGQAFHQGHYEAIKDELRAIALDHGYFDGKFTERSARIDRDGKTADVHIVYDSGQRYRFGKLRYNQTPLSAERLQELATFKEGDAFDRDKLARLQRRLEGTGYFDLVTSSAEPEQADADKIIPVDVSLKPKKTWLFEYGAGYGTDTGARVLIGAQNRLANDNGDTYGARLAPSERRSELTGYYDIPVNQLRGDKLHFEGNWLDTNDDLGKSQLWSTKAEHQMRLDRGWRFSYFLNVQYENYQLNGEPERSSFLVIPGVTLSSRQSNDALYPTHGYRWQLLGQGTDRAIGSDLRFGQIRIDAKWLSKTFDGQRLILRGNAGYTVVRTGDLDHLPLSLRFAAGGDQSVRGYDYNALGPTNDEGSNLGGRYLLVGSAEYDIKVADKWLAAAFVDTGNAFDALNHYKLDTGVGFGIRWLSPVGPIRLDLAHPLDDNRAFRIHFSMGPEL